MIPILLLAPIVSSRETLAVNKDGVSSIKVTWEKSADP